MKRVSKLLTALAAATMIMGGFISCSDSGDDTPVSSPKPNKPVKPVDPSPADPVDPTPVDPTPVDPSALGEATIYVVGDSTVSSFTDNYYYPRYGYGTQIGNNFNSKITVNNLALSGRSSKSFLTEANYATLTSSIKAGDYLVIGFGHNDEKSDDAERFASATGSTDTEGSFKYNLYNYYVKVAQDKGATPIICTPIVRLSMTDDYTGSEAHVTAAGDYRQAILDLGTEKSVQTVDLTTLTKEVYSALGHDEAIYFHAMTQGESTDDGVTVTPKLASVDKTHINIYGAKKVSYLFAKAIKESSCSLKYYIDDEKFVEPTKENDLVVNPNYKWVGYKPVNWAEYTPLPMYTTITEGWYGTVFGDTGGDPTGYDTAKENPNINGFYAQETEAGKFKVGCEKAKGKFAGSSDGFSFVFQQIPVSKNFTLTAKAKVTVSGNTKQMGFGLMLRDDCYVPVQDAGIVGNYVAAGFVTAEGPKEWINFSRATGTLTKPNPEIAAYYATDDTAEFKIERVGQVVKVTTIYKGETVTNTYTDFDFVEKDTDYFYAGMFGNRGTLVEFTDVVLTITGESQGA